MDHFNGFTDYLQFAFAREFRWKEGAQASFRYTRNRYEKLGNFLSQPLLKPVDFSLRNGRNPLFIVALTVSAIFVTTVLFYPAVFSGILTAALAASVKPVAFAAIQSTILGLGLRTLGRLNNRQLMEEWDQNHLSSQRIGSLKI